MANAHKLLDEAQKVGLTGAEALRFVGANGPDHMTRYQGRLLAMEITRRRNEIANAATQQAAAPAAGMDAESELFGDAEAAEDAAEAGDR